MQKFIMQPFVTHVGAYYKQTYIIQTYTVQSYVIHLLPRCMLQMYANRRRTLGKRMLFIVYQSFMNPGLELQVFVKYNHVET